MEKQDFIKYALSYLSRGISIIPISGDGDMKKPPQGFSWRKYQNIMATPEEVQAWADSYPNLNLGIVTGAISGIVVIDIDDRSIADTIEVPKNTPMTVTGKGYHVYCKMPKEPIKNSASKIADHVDIRGNGGYVLAPPSMHVSGNQYAWMNDLDTPLADLPQWIIQKYYPTDKKPKEQKVKVTTGKEVYGEGSRNEKIFRIACKMMHNGLSQEAVRAAISMENLLKCTPPLQDYEIDKIVESAFNYDGGQQRPLTDAGNGERLKDKYYRTLRYIPERGKWLQYNDSYWEEEPNEYVEVLAVDTVRGIPLEVPNGAEQNTIDAFNKFALTCESNSKIVSMVTRAKAVMLAKNEVFDKSKWVLNMANGTINLKTMEFKPHNSTDYLTKCGEAEYIEEAECPLWLNFIERIFRGNSELISYIQRAVGYSLTGETSEQIFFTLYGEGANGKSTFIDTIKKVIGTYGTQADFSTFISKKNTDAPKNDLAILQGSRFVAASESGSGRVLDDAVIKQVTGDSAIAVRFLFHENFIYTPQFKIWLATNHKPTIKDGSEGMWRRVKLIPFEVVIPPKERDKQLLSKLEAELPGILNWALEGCKAWQEGGMGICKTVDAATEEYREDNDILIDFLDDRCTVAEHESVKSSELYNEYKAWCEATGERTWAQRGFTKYLKDKGFSVVKRTDANYFKGIGVKEKEY